MQVPEKQNRITRLQSTSFEIVIMLNKIWSVQADPYSLAIDNS